MIAFFVTYKCECEKYTPHTYKLKTSQQTSVLLEVQAMKFSSWAYKHQGAAKILNEMS